MRSLVEALDRVKRHLGEKGFLEERPFLDYAAEKLQEVAGGGEGFTAFVSAPTGYGKTSLSLSIALSELQGGYKTVVTYPLRSLVEDQESKFKSLLSWAGFSRAAAVRMMGVPETPYFVHPVVLTTVDTLALMSVGLAPEDIAHVYRGLRDEGRETLGHYLFSWASVWLSTIVMDETHLLYDSEKSLSFLAALLRLSSKVFGNTVVLMSATLPRKFSSTLRSYCSGASGRKPIELSFSEDMDPRFSEERRGKRYRVNILELSREHAMDKLIELLGKSSFKRALVIFNTREDAQNFYRRLNSPNKVLLHSLFTAEDRKKKMEELRGMESSDARYIVVATQVIEAGVDITSDLIVTELAPAGSLIQRFGRFLRRPGEKCPSPGECAYVWYASEELDESEEKYKVYDKELTLATLRYLESNPDVSLHIGYESLLEEVYKGDVTVNASYVNQVESVLAGLSRSSERALELLIKSSGSLVREGALFTAVTTDGKEVAVGYDFLKKHCVDCPGSEREAVHRVLKGEKFRVQCSYSSELGVVCA
jgi:CRISPR-associated endonuclease/helicase Cas3